MNKSTMQRSTYERIQERERERDVNRKLAGARGSAACPVCGSKVATFVPHGGDGSAMFYTAHGWNGKAFCEASRQEVTPPNQGTQPLRDAESPPPWALVQERESEDRSWVEPEPRIGLGTSGERIRQS